MQQTLTFACPQCGRRMGVGLDLIGRPVRCPSCRQVVIAPSAGHPGGKPADPGTVPAPAASAPTPHPDSGYLPPAFKAAPTEGVESIFGETDAEDDSVFGGGARQTLPPIPRDDPSDLLQPTDRVVRNPELLAPPPAPPPPTDPPPADPFAVLATTPAPAASAVPPAADAPPVPAPTPAVPPAPRKWLVPALIGYAVLVTAVALWGWLRGGDAGHPLLSVPDFFGEYRRAAREKVSDLRSIPGLDQPPPEHLRVKLGGRLAVGDLEIEPQSITERRPVRVTEFKAKGKETDRKPTDHPCLVLTVKLRNRSRDVLFHPADPAYTRADAGGPVPLFGLRLPNGSTAFGGPVGWPFAASVRRMYLEGQEDDNLPLLPGRERTTVFASADRPGLAEKVRAAGGPVLWQLHVRRGLTRVRWEEVSVGAVVGVEFDPAEVKRADGERGA